MIEISTDLVEYSVDRSGDPVIHIFGRDKDGNAQQINVYGFRPYFYTSIDPNALTTTEEDPWIDEIELTSTQVNIQGDPVWKVFLKSPYHATIARQKFADRFVIDTGINNGVRAPSSECLVSEIEPVNIITPLRVCIIDIEADSQHIFPKPEKNKINCVTCHDSFTGVYDIFYLVTGENNIRDASALTCNTWFDPERIRLHVFLTEQDMLKALQEYVKTIDPDVLTGWNFTDFDMPYIMKRMDVLGLKPMEMGRLRGRFNPQWCSLKGRSEFDMLGGYKKITGGGKMSYRLDAIAEEEVDEHKVRYSGTIHDLWRDDPARFIEYNWKDVELCVKIDAKARIVDFVGCLPDT
jgi:DNA polymerase I